MKTLEERIMNELKAERVLVPRATAAPIPAPPPRWSGYLAAAAMIAVVTAIGAVWALGSSGTGPVASADGHVLTLHARHELLANEVDVIVTTGSPVTKEGGHDLYVALVGSEPLSFTPDGIEKPIIQRTPVMPRDARSDVIGPVVYLGEVDGEQFTIFSSTANSLPGFLGRWFSTLSSERLLCLGEPTGIACGAGWDTADVLNGSSTGRTGGPFRHHLVWAGLPADTVVVSWELSDGVVFWQRPAGLAAAMTWQTDEAGRSARVRAFTADGQLLLERTADF
ncbi:hypothetical protein BH23ACT5_BH23ACT5_04870 [soil metagenome]